MGKLPHVLLPGTPESRIYTSPARGGGEYNPIPRNRSSHGAFLKRRFENAWGETTSAHVATYGVRTGVYLEFRSDPDTELVTKSLENLRSKSAQVRLLNIRQEKDEQGGIITAATIYVPNSHRKYFLNVLDQYISENTIKGRPRNEKLVTSIADIRSALLVDSFWTDSKDLIPQEGLRWIEVWLRCDSDEDLRQFEGLLHQFEIETRPGVLKFPERYVKVINANKANLELITRSSDIVAEYRLAKETAAFFMEMNHSEQSEWVDELKARVTSNPESESSICILDTGVNNGHPLLKDILLGADCHSVDKAWGTNDHHSHGTLMAGTAAYGDLVPFLSSRDGIQINHVLESVKILPSVGTNPPNLWGYITSQAVNLAEIEAPTRLRTIALAVTATDTRDRGRPTSWSAEIDQLSFNPDGQRLFIISAGNSVETISHADAAAYYPEIQVTESAHDPSQSWNSLTAGAITSLTDISDPSLAGYSAVADRENLSPYSTTSATWEENKWPIKPELVLEGGNLAVDGSGFATDCDDLSILSLSNDTASKGYFYPFSMTSAATAQLARMAAELRALYPGYWEETIRALLVHSADWPDSLKRQFVTGSTKTDYSYLLKICGYGIPDLDKAKYSASNSLSLIAQSNLQPFQMQKSVVKTKDMHFYEFPWPNNILEALPDTVTVRMRVTLSYFIEPSPGEIGWKDRYRYASHALRFDINNPQESKDEFISRINKKARDEEGGVEVTTSSASAHWTFGSNARDRGSVHSDIWQGSAAELSQSKFIAVMPKIGWWKERKHLGRWDNQTRYSLVVSIETDDVNVDLYTPIVAKLGITVPVEIGV